MIFILNQVNFKYSATFTANEVMFLGDLDAGDGGAIAIGNNGEVTFDDFSFFTENIARSGGAGAAVANRGSVVFKRASYFLANAAKGVCSQTCAA